MAGLSGFSGMFLSNATDFSETLGRISGDETFNEFIDVISKVAYLKHNNNNNNKIMQKNNLNDQFFIIWR